VGKRKKEELPRWDSNYTEEREEGELQWGQPNSEEEGNVLTLREGVICRAISYTRLLKEEGTRRS